MTDEAQPGALREALARARGFLWVLLQDFKRLNFTDMADYAERTGGVLKEIDAALAALSAPASSALREALELLHQVMDQADNDLAGAHAEICKLQNLDPATHSWPRWTPQANSLRWHECLRTKFPLDAALSAPVAPVATTYEQIHQEQLARPRLTPEPSAREQALERARAEANARIEKLRAVIEENYNALADLAAPPAAEFAVTTGDGFNQLRDSLRERAAPPDDTNPIAETIKEYSEAINEWEQTRKGKYAPPADSKPIDEIITALYQRFKEWNKRGFGPDDVTWCEVKADVMALIAHPPGDSKPIDGWKYEFNRSWNGEDWETRVSPDRLDQSNPRVRSITPLYAHPPADSKPSAWRYEYAQHGGTGAPTNWILDYSEDEPSGLVRNITPLYAHPPVDSLDAAIKELPEIKKDLLDAHMLLLAKYSADPWHESDLSPIAENCLLGATKIDRALAAFRAALERIPEEGIKNAPDDQG